MTSRNRLSFWMCAAVAVAAPGVALAQFPQGFEGPAGAVTALPTDWITVNTSPGGPGTNPNWQQRTDGAVFTAHGGIGYAFANYNTSTGANTCSNHMMSPVVTLDNGAVIKFWTRSTGGAFPDRLVLTYSTNGTSQAVTDFANLANPTFHVLLTVNPNLTATGYPAVWTQFVSPPLSGLAGPTQGRIAFWYYVTNGGPAGANSDYIGVDDVEFIPPGVTTGACCDGAGSCTLTVPPPAGCSAAGSTYFGIASDCGAVSCVGKCCQPDGFCSNLAPNACTGAGFVFSGIGTACNPLTPDECLGRCCLPDGTCLADGQTPCVSSGGTFGGIGVACGDGSACKGRCCVGTTCIADQTPNQCAAAPGGPGVITLGGSCQLTNDFTFNTSVAIPDGVAGGGLGAQATDVQNVAGVSGVITDLNVGVQINHTFMGDVIVAIEHLGTSVTVIDMMGHTAIDCGGCAEANIDVVLDDEGTGGAIEDQCNATTPTAQSPPNFTPNNPLSAFDGLSPNGAWTIKMQDACGVDVGTLLRWSLKFAAPGSPCAPSCACKGDMNGSGTVNGADINKFALCVASGGGGGCACADINGGGITVADVTPFVNFLISGTGSCVP